MLSAMEIMARCERIQQPWKEKQTQANGSWEDEIEAKREPLLWRGKRWDSETGEG